MQCPSCRAPMENRPFPRRPQGTADLDLCWDCHAIWFDAWESVQLTPGAVIELFRLIDAHRDRAVRPLADSAGCPKCRARLVLTHDVQRTNRITYHRCPAGHGRLTTFFQFLREKNFVRSLTNAEVTQLRATVTQVRCSSCGGAVSVERDAACPYCRSPISILDADSVRKALAELTEQERARKPADPVVAQVDAAIAAQAAARRIARAERPHGLAGLQIGGFDLGADIGGIDLVGEAIGAILNAFD